MGAWGIGPFENDGALDWLADLEEASGLTVIRETFGMHETALREGETEPGEEVIAAAEVVAALLGRPGKDLPESLEEWLEGEGKTIKPDKGLVDHAVRSVRLILDHPDCNLRQCWEEVEDGAAWRAGVEGLLARLRTF